MAESVQTPCVTFIKGRGAVGNPQNRFERLHIEVEPEWLPYADQQLIRTQYFADHSQDILARNNSPDISFDYSINPYRGCEHGCIYCYARPTHEYFGLSAGLDFETKIMVKKDAPEFLEKRFASPRWQPQVVALSGNTDCYQPVEKALQITRRCLEVFLEFRNPVMIVTKSALLLRDLDLLQELARLNLVAVTISVTTLDNRLARVMEPRASAPVKRLEVLEKLVAAGVSPNVNVAPVIPGLTEEEMPTILQAAAGRGVLRAAYILLRLPHSVKELFRTWLLEHYPNRAKKVLHAVQDTRDGRLNDPCFSTRQSGVGVRAEAIRRIFELSCQKFGLNQEQVELTTNHFRRGNLKQGELF